MKCKCKNCKHCLLHPDGLLCNKKLIFVETDDYCEEFENDEMFKPSMLVIIAIIAMGLVLFLSKFL